MSREEEIIIVDQRRLPIMVDAEVISNGNLSITDIAVFTCICYIDEETIDEKVRKAISKRLGITLEEVRKSLDNLSDNGIIY